MNISSVDSSVIQFAVADATIRPRTPEQASDRAKLVQAVQTVNEGNALGEKNELTFVMDRATGRTLTRVIDRKTKEVVMQIPAEYVLRMAEQLKQNSGG
jgi:flagellar protein FlaG